MHITDLTYISASANLDESLVSERNAGQEGGEGRCSLQGEESSLSGVSFLRARHDWRGRQEREGD